MTGAHIRALKERVTERRTGGRQKGLTLRLPVRILEQVKSIAARYDVSQTAVIELALSVGLPWAAEELVRRCRPWRGHDAEGGQHVTE